MSCMDIKESICYLGEVGVMLTLVEKFALQLKNVIGSILGSIPTYKYYRFYNSNLNENIL